MSSHQHPRSLNILSVEDEPLIAQRLERLSGEILGEQLLGFQQVRNLNAAMAALEDTAPDLVFLDLNLSGQDGYDLLARFTSYSSQTIVVSAYAERAAKAFELGVLDFVVKPFSQDRLATALARAQARIPQTVQPKLQFLTFRNNRRTDVVPISEIACLKGADKYTEAVLCDGSTRLHDKTLADLETLLPDDFFRVHKSFIVPIYRIKRIESSPGSKYEILLNTGELLPVGRTRIADLRARLAG